MSSDAVTGSVEAVPTDSGTVATPAVQDNKGDFDARVRTDPEFALAQVKEAQRKLTQYQNKFGGDVEKVVDVLGGKQGLLQYVQRAYTLFNNPTMKPVIDEFERTGKLPTPQSAQADNDGEFEEPWTRDLRQSQSEVASLRARLDQLSGERGVEKVQGFIRNFTERYNLSDEGRTELQERMIEQAKTWGSNAQGRDVLGNMNQETFDSLALGRLGKDRIREAILREEELRRTTRSNAATDSPGGVRSQAKRAEAPAGMSPVDAVIEAFKREGLDPYKDRLI